MSVKTIVSSGRQYINGDGEVMGLTSKDSGKHWRICRRSTKLWIAWNRGTITGEAANFNSERAAQAALDSLARSHRWKILEATA